MPSGRPATTTGMTALAVDTALGRELALKGELRGYGTAMVGFSAGVDSTYLLDMAHEVLGARVTAVTADSPSLARSSLAEAEAFCAAKGIRHVIVPTDEFEQEEYLANDGQRCFYCKAALMRAMNGLARATAAGRVVSAGSGTTALLLGAIADDLKDYRPGMRAAGEAGARWPLADLGFTKVDVRVRSRARGLISWNRPAEPCLSSRVPYGERVTVAGLRMIEAAEAELKRLGFAECRARHHRIGESDSFLCRIEVPSVDLPRLTALRDELLPVLTALGYRSVTLDLAGLQSGGFNRLLGTAFSGKVDA